ncbi:MAG: hypothetical protein K2H53_00865 [Clostridia bacterium]|nr:hypothetical protein [Clostridia bacterium]
MNAGPFPTFEAAEEAKKAYEGKYDVVYSRPNPNEEEGGYIVIYKNNNNNIPWWTHPAWGGCPRGR